MQTAQKSVFSHIAPDDAGCNAIWAAADRVSVVAHACIIREVRVGDGSGSVACWNILHICSVVSYILQPRHWLGNNIGTGIMWLASHPAHTSLYAPFPAGTQAKFCTAFYINNSFDRLGRGAWQAARPIINIAPLKFSFAFNP